MGFENDGDWGFRKPKRFQFTGLMVKFKLLIYTGSSSDHSFLLQQKIK
jgi:hypothetical protein